MRHGPPMTVYVRLFVGPTISWEIRTPWGPGNPISDHQSVHIGAKFLCNQYPPSPAFPAGLQIRSNLYLLPQLLQGLWGIPCFIKASWWKIHNAKVTTCLVHFHRKIWRSIPGDLLIMSGSAAAARSAPVSLHHEGWHKAANSVAEVLMLSGSCSVSWRKWVINMGISWNFRTPKPPKPLWFPPRMTWMILVFPIFGHINLLLCV